MRCCPPSGCCTPRLCPLVHRYDDLSESKALSPFRPQTLLPAQRLLEDGPTCEALLRYLPEDSSGGSVADAVRKRWAEGEQQGRGQGGAEGVAQRVSSNAPSRGGLWYCRA